MARAYDPINDRMLVFPVNHGGPGCDLNIFYALDFTTLTWSQIVGTGSGFTSNPMLAGAVYNDGKVHVWTDLAWFERDVPTWEARALDVKTNSWSHEFISAVGATLTGAMPATPFVIGNRIMAIAAGLSSPINGTGPLSTDSNGIIVYDPAADDSRIDAILPAEIANHRSMSFCATDRGHIIMYGGAVNDVPINRTYLLDSYQTAFTRNKLYASPDNLPSEAAQFTSIADLSWNAEAVSIDVLNDRAIIANIKDYPLVFLGAMDSVGADWPFPLYAFLSYDGIHLHDVSGDVCDSDPNTSADCGGLSTSGFLGITTDVPTLDALYFEMAKGNTGLTGTSSVFTTKITFTDDTAEDRVDLKDSITSYTRTSSCKGKFNHTVAAVTQGMLIVFDDATTAIIITKTSDGTNNDNVELDSDHASGTVTAIYGLAVVDNRLGPILAVGSFSIIYYDYFREWNGLNKPLTSIIQIIPSSKITADGEGQFKITVSSAEVPLKVACASLVERDGSTANGTGTPIPVTWNGGDAGFQIEANTTIESDPILGSIDHTKDQLFKADISYVSIYVDERGHYIGLADGSYTPPAGTSAKVTQASGLNKTLYYQAEYGYYYKDWDGTDATASYNQQTVTGFTLVAGAHIGIFMISASGRNAPTPNLQVSCTTDDSQANLTYADKFLGVTITERTPGASKIYHAVSFDGRASDVWIWKNAAWYQIIRLSGSDWQYRDSGGVWHNATINSLLGAEVQAFSVVENQIEASIYNALTPADWTSANGFNPNFGNTLDFCQAFLADGLDVPWLIEYAIQYASSGVVRVDVRKGGAWVVVPASDNTRVNGISLAQSGTMAFTKRTTADYDVIDGVAGFHWRVWTNGTSAGTAISQIKYKAPCQPLQNIGTGQPDTVAGAIYHDVSEDQPNDIGVVLSDYVETHLSAATIPMDTDDYLYFGYPTRFNALLITPLTGSENATTSVMSGEIWTGEEWVAVTISDGTAASGKTVHKQGIVYWTLPTTWKTCIPVAADYPRCYWIRLKVSASLTSTTALVEVRAFPLPDPIMKHRLVQVMGNRLALAGTPAELDRVDISQEFKEYGFNGPDSGAWRVGGQDSAIAMIRAWNGLFVAKPESWHSFNGKTFDTIEASGKTPINNRVIVKAPAPGDQSGNLSGLYFINEKGAHVAASLQADNNFGTARVSLISDTVTWWDDGAEIRVDKNWLFRACGVYWPLDNLILWSVPLIVNGASEQQTCNRILVYDLSLRCWYPPWKITAASLCVAYHHNENAPGKLGPLGIYAGNYSGQIIRLFDGYTDLGAAVQGWFETGWLNLGGSEFEKTTHRLRLYGYSNADVTVEIKVDGEETVRPGYSKTIQGLTGLTGKFLGPDKDIKKYVYGNFQKVGIHFAGDTNLYGIEIESYPDREELLRK